jgi:hypothetical protein
MNASGRKRENKLFTQNENEVNEWCRRTEAWLLFGAENEEKNVLFRRALKISGCIVSKSQYVGGEGKLGEGTKRKRVRNFF